MRQIFMDEKGNCACSQKANIKKIWPRKTQWGCLWPRGRSVCHYDWLLRALYLKTLPTFHDFPVKQNGDEMWAVKASSIIFLTQEG